MPNLMNQNELGLSGRGWTRRAERTRGTTCASLMAPSESSSAAAAAAGQVQARARPGMSTDATQDRARPSKVSRLSLIGFHFAGPGGPLMIHCKGSQRPSAIPQFGGWGTMPQNDSFRRGTQMCEGGLLTAFIPAIHINPEWAPAVHNISLWAPAVQMF